MRKGFEAGIDLGHAIGKGSYLAIGLGNLASSNGIGARLDAGIGGQDRGSDCTLRSPMGFQLLVQKVERASGDCLARRADITELGG